MGTLPVEEIRSMYLGMLCILPFTSGLNVLGFMIGTALIQWIAGLFGGTGTYDKLVYPFGAIYAPFLIASSAIGFLGLIPYVGICFSIFSIGLWVYQIVLRILAVQAVNDLDTGKATLSVLLPGFVIFLFFCLCFALIFGGLLAMGPAIGDLFNGIVNDLVQEIY